MNVLIQRGCFVGKGAEAMMLSVKSELGRRLANLRIFAELPERSQEDAVAAGVTPVTLDWPGGGRARNAARLTAHVVRNPRLLPDTLREPWRVSVWRDRLRCMDAVIDIGGHAYGDPWAHRDFATRTASCVRYCKNTGKPFVFMPQAWGPFSAAALAAPTCDMCRRATAFYARDLSSRTHLAKLLHVAEDEIPLADDIAFRFRDSEEVDPSNALRACGIDVRKPLVGIIPNRRVYERMSGKARENSYIRALAEASRICRTLGATVLILPHEMRFGDAAKWDPSLCRLVASAAGDDDGIKALADRWRSAAEVKAIIGKCELVIGSRFHSIVAALSSRVPCIAWGWSHKYEELMRSVELEGYALDCRESGVNELIPLIQSAWNGRTAIRQTLVERMPQIEKRVDAFFDQVATLIQGQPSVTA